MIYPAASMLSLMMSLKNITWSPSGFGWCIRRWRSRPTWF